MSEGGRARDIETKIHRQQDVRYEVLVAPWCIIEIVKVCVNNKLYIVVHESNIRLFFQPRMTGRKKWTSDTCLFLDCKTYLVHIRTTRFKRRG